MMTNIVGWIEILLFACIVGITIYMTKEGDSHPIKAMVIFILLTLIPSITMAYFNEKTKKGYYMFFASIGFLFFPFILGHFLTPFETGILITTAICIKTVGFFIRLRATNKPVPYVEESPQ
jgi:hypothetical protein